MKDRRPRLGACVLVCREDGAVLLARRERGPNAGKWVIPGGGVEYRETWRDAAKREVREETGIECEVGPTDAPYVMEIIGPASHRVCLVVPGWPVGGELRGSTETPTVGWRMPEEIQAMHHADGVSPPVVRALAYYGYLRPSP